MRTPRRSVEHARLSFDPWLAAAALLAVIPILIIIRPGVPHTADGQVHLLRTLEVARLLRAGVLYPRWAPDFYLGYGYPFFNFYAPGAHLLAGLLSLSGLGVLRSVVAAQVFALLLYPTGAYLAARALFRGDPGEAGDPDALPAVTISAAALISAALYLYAPLRLRELFIQGNLSQLLALGLLPWCAWLLTEAARRASGGWAVAAGAALALLVYAHHPSAFLAFPLLAVYGAAIAIIAGAGGTGSAGGGFRSGRAARSLATVAGALCLGLALSAPFWLPAVVELRDVGMRSIETGMFNARLNLVPLAELLSPAILLDDTALNPIMPNSLGTAQIVLSLAGLALALLWVARSPRKPRSAEREDDRGGAEAVSGGWSRRQTGLALLVTAGLLAVSMALMLPLAALAWETLPLAGFIAFPWRLLGPALLWSSLLGGAALFLVPARWRTPAMAVLLVLIPLGVATYLFPRPFAAAQEPVLADIARYELNGGARGTASANEYLPRWVTDPNPPAAMAATIAGGGAPDRLERSSLPSGSQVLDTRSSALEDVYRLALPAPAQVRLARFYFPGWNAWVDGRPATFGAAGPYGLIEVAMPAGAHDLRVRFGSTPSAAAGSVLALIGVMGALGWGLWRWRRRRADRSGPLGAARGDDRAPGPRRRVAPLLAAAIILALAGAMFLVVEPSTRWFRQRSPVEAPAGMLHAVNARFANGLELIGYSLANENPRQGETLGVRLYWRALRPQDTPVRPFLHLDSPGGDVTWANQTKMNAGDKPSTAWPVGFYVLDDYRLELPAGTPPVVARLRAGLLDEAGHLVPLEDGPESAGLAEVRVREAHPLEAGSVPGRETAHHLGPALQLAGSKVTLAGDPPALDVALYWQASAPVPADYTVFIHVLDASGRTIAQGDGSPLSGWYPTSAWLPGQVIADERRIPLPAGASPGGLRVAVGLYMLEDGSRLPVTDAAGMRRPDDQILLAPGGP